MTRTREHSVWALRAKLSEAITPMVLAPLREHCPSEITYSTATPFFATHAEEVAPVTYLSTLPPESKNFSQKAQPPNGWASTEHQGPAP